MVSSRSDPLTVLIEDRLSCRHAMADLMSLASAPEPDRATAEAAMRFLRDEIPQQLACTKLDLFPILRQRAEPEDCVEMLFARLERDDLDAAEARNPALKILWAMSVGRRVSAERRARLSAYAVMECKRVALENAVMLPLARVRLTTADREQLLWRMSRRRGPQSGLDFEPVKNDDTSTHLGKGSGDERGGGD